MPAEPDIEKNQEGLNDIVPSLVLNIPDDQLSKDIEKYLAESLPLYTEMEQIGKENVRSWEGKQLEAEKIRRGKARIVDNRLFLSGETIIPIMTSRTPEPTLRLKEAQLREKLKQMLMNLWEVPTDDDTESDMQANMEMISRHWMLYRIGILKYSYDPEIDDVRTAFVRPDRVRFDAKGKNVDKCRFIAEFCDTTLKKLVEQWPGKKDEILVAAGRAVEDDSSVTYIEFWTNEYCVYKFKDVILEKKKNPNFDYGDMGGENEEPTPEGENVEKAEGIYNLFKKPRKPYLTLSVFNLGKTVYDDTSLFEQGKTLQDSINKLKRNITDNASDNGVLAGSGDQLDKKVLEAYTGAPDEKIWIKNGDVRTALTRLPPKDMAPYVFSDLQDSKREIDNLFGAHDTTRGERSGPKTKGEAELLKQGDMGRIDLLSRALDRIAQDWYLAMLHMYFVFKTAPVEVNSNDEEGTSIVFNRDEYINPETGKLYKIIIKVKPGSAMSIDKDARRAEAFEQARAGLIDPITFFEKMDYSNPQEMAKKLFLWQKNPIALFPDLLAQQQAQMQAQQAQQLDAAANQPLPEGTPITLPQGTIQ